MLHLQLHAGRQERRALKQAGNHWVHALGDKAAKPLRNAGVLSGKIARLLVQELQFAVIEIEKFAVHRPRPG